MDIGSLGTILGVWAHPDDETYLSAGIMAAAVRNGQRVVCVTATRGEAGSWDEERWPSRRMGEIREAELMKCLAILGIADHRWLDYHDARCAEVPFEEGVARVLAILREVAPDTVLTFGPDGMTDHPDHKAISAWTTEAFARAAAPGARLYYATTTPDWAERWVPLANRFDVFAPGTPPVTPREELAICLSLPGDIADLKLEAIAAHESQVEGLMTVFGVEGMRAAHLEEFYRHAAPR